MITINHLAKTFNRYTPNEIVLFTDFSLTVKPKELTAIIGPNGCGKSTLMNMIAGTVAVDSGEIILDETDITHLSPEKRAQLIGRVYQDPSFGVASNLTILENMALADKKGQKFGLKRLIQKNRIPEYKTLLESIGLGLESKLNTKVSYLSGGQRQSLAIVMAAMNQPKLLLLDEHTAALDPKTSRVIMEKTRSFLEDLGIITIMISHNMRDAIRYSDRVIMLNHGEITLDEPSSELDEAQLIEIYQQM